MASKLFLYFYRVFKDGDDFDVGVDDRGNNGDDYNDTENPR